MPAVSVLLPCYNSVTTLPEALHSLDCQTLSDFEVIMVDDGSEDGSAAILQQWAYRDPRFHYLHQSHQGIIQALNRGIACCQAPLVARMDADDRSHPDRLAQQVDFLSAHPEVGVVSCRVVGFPPDHIRQGFAVYLEWINTITTPEDFRREIFVESPLPHPSVTFRKECILQAGAYQEHGWPEDYDLWLRLYLNDVLFARLPGVLLEWREHPGRLTRIDRRYSLENFFRAKAYYLMRGPLAGCDGVFIWGAGMMGRRLGKQLLQLNAPLAGYVDIDPLKIGRTRYGFPVISPADLSGELRRFARPVLLAAVGSRGARPLVRQRIVPLGLVEGQEWWFAA